MFKIIKNNIKENKTINKKGNSKKKKKKVIVEEV